MPTAILEAPPAALAAKIDSLPRLASLRSVNQALSALVNSEHSFTSQIAEIIRRDPSLTTRLLKLVNSVYYGLQRRITSIEDAIFLLGLRQIRELALATPVIEEFDRLRVSKQTLDWRLLWQHSIGTAILTRELFAAANVAYTDDTDYVVGLVHNVGKIVLAVVEPDEAGRIARAQIATSAEVCHMEAEAFGWDHARVGAYFLQRHQISPEVVEAVAFHHAPELAPEFGRTAAAVQIADHMARSAGILGVERCPTVAAEEWTRLSGWGILFGKNPAESRISLAYLRHTLARLPAMLNGMV